MVLRVLELSTWLAGPGAGALLADQGADVIKVETSAGDPGRDFIAALGGDELGFSPSFALLNRGKRSVVLDLAEMADRAHFDGLLESADIFLTNLRHGSLTKLGLEPESIMQRFPRLIFASVTGLGLRGPDRNEPAYDVGGFWARSGLMDQLRLPGLPPPSPTGAYGDIVTSLAVFAGVMAALYRRVQTGTGGLVETSLAQVGAFAMSGDLAVQAARGTLKGQRTRTECRTPLVNSYQAQGGQWFFLTGIEAARHLPSVARAIGRDDLLTDARFGDARSIRANSIALIAILDVAFGQAPLAHWREQFAKEEVCWQPIATPSDVLADPQLEANGVFSPVWDGNGLTPMVTSPFSIDRIVRAAAPAPRTPGEDGSRLVWSES